MARISRRQFLKLTGIVLIGSNLTPSAALFDQFIPNVEAFHGRALNALIVFRAPNSDATIVSRLWADSVVTLLDTLGDWYLLPEGYVMRSHVQPMTEYTVTAKIVPPKLPCWMEVTAPVAVIRQWCAADAPLITRIGHGGVAHIIDRMPDGRGGLEWYAVANDEGDAPLGWTQVAGWRPVEIPIPTTTNRVVHIDPHTQQITALEDDCAMLVAPVSVGTELARGKYSAVQRSPARTVYGQRGAPWTIDFGVGAIAGAYWHNQFGQPTAGSNVEIPPVLARWLFTWLGDDGQIVIL